MRRLNVGCWHGMMECLYMCSFCFFIYACGVSDSCFERLALTDFRDLSVAMTPLQTHRRKGNLESSEVPLTSQQGIHLTLQWQTKSLIRGIGALGVSGYPMRKVIYMDTMLHDRPHATTFQKTSNTKCHGHWLSIISQRIHASSHKIRLLNQLILQSCGLCMTISEPSRKITLLKMPPFSKRPFLKKTDPHH